MFFSTSLRSAQTSLSAALPPAVKMPTTLIDLLVAEVEPAADLGPLEPPRHALADDALALARRPSPCPATILKSGRSFRDAG